MVVSQHFLCNHTWYFFLLSLEDDGISSDRNKALLNSYGISESVSFVVTFCLLGLLLFVAAVVGYSVHWVSGGLVAMPTVKSGIS
jgi:hypothetical protein